MKRPFFAALVLGLVVVPGAAAKLDLKVVRLCGPDACVETRDEAVRDALRRLLDVSPSSLALPPPVSRYYVIRGDGDEPYGVLVPGRTTLRWNVPGAAATWVDGGQRLREKLELLTAGLRAYAPPRPVRVVVNGRLASRPALFAPLLGELEPRSRPRVAGPVWVPVTVIWNRPNPWTEASSMFYDPDDRALFRGGGWFHVPRQLGRLITRR